MGQSDRLPSAHLATVAFNTLLHPPEVRYLGSYVLQVCFAPGGYRSLFLLVGVP
jgi:hypothetical protein